MDPLIYQLSAFFQEGSIVLEFLGQRSEFAFSVHFSTLLGVLRSFGLQYIMDRVYICGIS
jgi:hypothetical protein